MKRAMQLEQLENSLPNGFHDAKIEAISVDYVLRKAVMNMRLHVGRSDADTSEEREAYKPAELQLSDFLYLVVEAPDQRYEYAEKKGLWISSAGRANEDPAPAPPIPLEQLPAGASAYWFFVNDWNSFIHLAAMQAHLEWGES